MAIITKIQFRTFEHLIFEFASNFGFSTSDLLLPTAEGIMQNEPNFKIGKILLKLNIIKNYDDFCAFKSTKNEPKRTQFKPNFNAD